MTKPVPLATGTAADSACFNVALLSVDVVMSTTGGVRTSRLVVTVALAPYGSTAVASTRYVPGELRYGVIEKRASVGENVIQFGSGSPECSLADKTIGSPSGSLKPLTAKLKLLSLCVTYDTATSR